MLVRATSSRDDGDKGFTLVELLVVMIIIGILAAIAVPVFLSQRAKAYDSSVKSDVSVLGKEIATYWVDGTSIPTVAISGAGNAAVYQVASTTVGRVSSGVGFPVQAPGTATSANTTGWTSTTWCVNLTNASGSTKTYKYSAQNGLETGTCSSPSAP